MSLRARDFDEAYLKLHIPKEDAFWSTYMGTEPDPNALERAETALKKYITDPENLKKARAALAAATEENEKISLEGWVRFFETNLIEDPESRALQQEVLGLERELFRKRAELRFDYRDQDGAKHQGSTNVLGVNVSTARDPIVRKTSWQAMHGLEEWVLANGYLDIVRKRNVLARRLGFENFFAYKLMRNEGLTIEELDAIFGPFEKATRSKCLEEVTRVSKEKGPEALEPWNFLFLQTGDTSAEMDPYFPFAQSVARWGLSFWRLGIRYRKASLTLDLLDRPGKYENGFMHGPVPCYEGPNGWVPARINFTSNATPNQVGSGRRGLDTLFHEGGHAAHFSNILQNSPSFSQEFPPTSMAFAETQSMFCDSLLDDADWLKLYAKTADGREMPDDLIRKNIQTSQPLFAFRERGILVVAVFEQRLYSLSDSELTAENVLKLARRCEKEIFGLDAAPRPILAIPHLLDDSGACSYQGYLLAHMAVYQTRAHFRKKYGYLVDQPRIGQDLQTAYWAPGNRITHATSVRNLTGENLSGDALAAVCTASNEEAWGEARKLIEAAKGRKQDGTLESVDLDAHIRAVHGAEVIAETKKSFAQFAYDFAKWVDDRYPRK